jgi:hypothetical protein
MRLNLTFASAADASNFLTKTGETDITSVHVGLINTAVNSEGFVSGTATGDAIDFLVKQQDGSWVTESIQDPFARLTAGAVIEPLDAPIKMLATETWAQTRIENRYPPIVENLMIADYNPQRRVEVIVVDSGINAAHQEFANATIENLYKVPAFNDYNDDVMHGTAVTSLIVGSTLGINSHAVIKNVKINGANRKPTLGELGAAFDAINTYHATCPEIPKVVNLSWRMPRSAYIDSKINLLIEAGILVVAAAGNTAMNIDEVTPAGTEGTFVVAGSTESDAELCAIYGETKKLSLYAPGENITVAKFNSTNEYSSASGSSFSAAFASAVASLYFGLGANCLLNNQVIANIISDSTPGAIGVNSKVSAAENKLLHRPNASTMAADLGLFTGVFAIEDIVSDPATRTELQLSESRFDIRHQFPMVVGKNVTYSLVYDDAEVQSLMAPTIIADGRVTLALVPGTTLPEGTKVKLMSFKVAMNNEDGLSMTGNRIYYFIRNSDVNYATDIAPILEELNVTSGLEGQGFSSSYGNNK